jgi:electron transfer flavoprotein alpha subunit
MKIVVFIEQQNGKIGKAGLEAMSYGVALANQFNATMEAAAFGVLEGDGGAGEVGVSKVYSIGVKGLDSIDRTQAAMKLIESSQADMIVFSHDNAGKEVASRLSIKLKCGLISGVTALPAPTSASTVQRNVFSGKAISLVSSSTAKTILTLLPNSFGVKRVGGTATVEVVEASADEKVKCLEVRAESSEHGIPLPEADIVVSGGRGMKGPEHWSPIEELAKELGAATACSRPVSDIGWRPHHEHVGQTGIAIRPNLYIAVGISGAIQHLAGVNGSKVIVVINKDPEAPFFKAADYGIVGDAFEVLPKIIEAAKAFNSTK